MKYTAFASTFLFAISCTGTAQAFHNHATGFYISGAVGTAKISDLDAYSYADDASDDEIYNTKIDDMSQTLQLSGGYRFDMGLGVDIGYLDLGEAGLKERTRYLDLDGKVDLDETYKYNLKPKGFVTGINYQLDVNDWLSFAVKSGLFIWSMDFKAQSQEYWPYYDDYETDSWKKSSSGVDIYIGLSAIYTIANRLSIDASLSRYSFELETVNRSHDANVFSLGLTYYFGSIPGKRNNSYTSRPRQQTQIHTSNVATQPNSKTSGTKTTATTESAEEFSLLPETQPAAPRPVERNDNSSRSTRSNSTGPGDVTACSGKYKHLFPLCN